MRVAITGLGIVAPGAVGVERFRALLDEGRTAVAPVDRFDTAGLASHTAAVVRDFKARDFIAPMKMRRMNLLSRYAVAAAKLAMEDAGVALPNTTGVALGTSFGPVQTSVDYMQEYVEKGAALAPPQLFAESVANAPGSHIAIEHDLRGFNVTITQRESSALAAAMYAAAQIVKGAAGAALKEAAVEHQRRNKRRGHKRHEANAQRSASEAERGEECGGLHGDWTFSTVFRCGRTSGNGPMAPLPDARLPRRGQVSSFRLPRPAFHRASRYP